MKKVKGVWDCLKGIFIALTVSMLCVLLFAVLIKALSLPSDCIKPVNQVIKVVAVFVGCLAGARRPLLLLKGGIIGFIATLTEYFLYGAIAGGADFGLFFVIDALFGIALGVISATVYGIFKRA